MVDVGQTSRRLLDLEPDTPYIISLAARTGAGLGAVSTVEDRTLKMSGTYVETVYPYTLCPKKRPPFYFSNNFTKT